VKTELKFYYFEMKLGFKMIITIVSMWKYYCRYRWVWYNWYEHQGVRPVLHQCTWLI